LVEGIGNYAPRVGRSLKKLLGCGDNTWYTLFSWVNKVFNKYTQHNFYGSLKFNSWRQVII